ncbi:MAG TPA: hypothetical protein VMG12_01255 [Polyangiaceae bacterium]|nr:hypothetical protein [Polyangiaceae bacterium]
MAGVVSRKWLRPATASAVGGARPAAGRVVALLERHFRLLVLVFAGGYLLLQLRYIAGLPLVMDEFANAAHIIRVARGVPYRDYVPYKTVLGYYLLLPGLVVFASSWIAMLAAKVEIAFFTAIVMSGASFRLRRHFAAPAVLGGLLLLCTQSTFLERSSELRVDMLSALFGLVSLLAFLERRAVVAGIAAGAAVLMTQKGAYFAISLGGAAALLLLRWRRWALFVEAVRTGLAALGVLFAYVGFWCVVGSPRVLWQSMFEGPQLIAFKDLYDLSEFWTQTLERNPIFYALGAAGGLLLLPWRPTPRDTPSERLWAYSLVHVALCVWHKQPWPYFFVMLIPTVWVLVVAALDRQLDRGPAWHLGVSGLVVVAAIVSLTQRLPLVLERSSTAQRRVVEAAEAFLLPGDTYLAGTELLWRQSHMTQLSWLDRPHIEAVRKDPEAALRELRGAPPRLVIDNYRVEALPPVVREQLSQSFIPVGGTLWTYAPLLPEGESETHYAQGGLYRVSGPKDARVSIDGGPWLVLDARITLTAGVHHVRSVAGGRLAAWSEAPRFVEQTARLPIRFFERVYTY